VVGGRTLEEGKQVVDNINERGGEAVFRQTDVRNPDDLRQFTETAINEFGGIDISTF
jgi:NAD(P)-dependent dehydrogenase (short-subunit alcohol dehydrogenase family)